MGKGEKMEKTFSYEDRVFTATDEHLPHTSYIIAQAPPEFVHLAREKEDAVFLETTGSW